MTRVNKEEGHGQVNSIPPIEPEDFDKLSSFFKEMMAGPPNPAVLQQMLVFNLIYYLGHCGHENLRKMTKDHFQIAVDHDNKRYIYQKIKEFDKNHRQDDMTSNNDGRMYEITGIICFLNFTSIDLPLM